MFLKETPAADAARTAIAPGSTHKPALRLYAWQSKPAQWSHRPGAADSKRLAFPSDTWCCISKHVRWLSAQQRLCTAVSLHWHGMRMDTIPSEGNVRRDRLCIERCERDECRQPSHGENTRPRRVYFWPKTQYRKRQQNVSCPVVPDLNLAAVVFLHHPLGTDLLDRVSRPSDQPYQSISLIAICFDTQAVGAIFLPGSSNRSRDPAAGFPVHEVDQVPTNRLPGSA